MMTDQSKGNRRDGQGAHLSMIEVGPNKKIGDENILRKQEAFASKFLEFSVK